MVDHGPGIPPESAEHVFERFWRSDPARVRAQGGAGLGLSIVSAIADAHGGRVWVAETTGGGATFSVELPTEPDAEPSRWGTGDASASEASGNAVAGATSKPFAEGEAPHDGPSLTGQRRRL